MYALVAYSLTSNHYYSHNSIISHSMFHCTLSLSNRPILLSKDTQPTIHLLSMVSRSTTLVDVQVGMNWVVQRILRFKSVQIVVMPMPLVFHLSIPRKELNASGQQVVTTLALQ